MKNVEKNCDGEIMRLREEVKALEKLSSLGMLSAGIAHEIQNPLNFVINFSKISVRLSQDLDEILGEQQGAMSAEIREELSEITENLRKNLEKIGEHSERAISIIRGILLYSRSKEDEYIFTDVVKLVKEYVWLSYHAMRANHKGFNLSVIENYDTSLSPVNLIPCDFSRVVLNLMNNACYAVMTKAEQGGDDFRPEIKVEVSKEEEGFCFVVADNGTGMPEEVRVKLFTPFFTTKPIGEGTGLGLSIARSIIEEKHNGKIEVETEEGKGTKMIIKLKSKK